MNKHEQKARSITPNENTLLVVIISLVILSFFYIQWTAIFTTHDDMYYAMLVRQNKVTLGALAQASNTGRFYFLYTMYLYAFPYIFNSILGVKIISALSILFSVFCLAYLLYKHIDLRFALVAILLFFAFAQIDNEHNIFTSYVFHHQITIGLILLSICHLISFYKTQQKRYLRFSCIFYTIPVFIYEGFLMYSLLIFAVCIYETFGVQKNKWHIQHILKIFWDLKYHILSSLIFLFFYFFWRYKNPTYNYSGAIFEYTNLISILKVILTYAVSLFPGNSFFHNINNISVGYYLDFGSVMKGILAGFCLYQITSYINYKITLKTLFALLSLSILGIIIPCIPYGFTTMHVNWVQNGSYGFVPSFFSYFFWIIFLASLYVFCFQKIKFKKLFQLLTILSMLIIVCLTDSNNEYFSDMFHKEFEKNTAFDRIISSNEFLSIPDNSTVYIPDYIGLLASMSITEDYLKTYSDKNIHLVNHQNELSFDVPTYMIRYEANSQSIFWGQIDSDFYTNEIIFYENDSSPKSVILESKGNQLIKNNLSTQQLYPQFAGVKLQFSSEQKSILDGKNIKMDSLNIINKIVDTPIININYRGGFYEHESWGCWANQNGIIEIVNKSDTPQTIKIELTYTSASPGNYLINILLPNGTNDQQTITHLGTPANYTIQLQPGNNNLELRSDAPAIKILNDPRDLSFSISNLKLSF